MTPARGLFMAVLLGALLHALPAWAGTLVDQADLIRRLIPSVVNITARAEITAPPVTEQAGASAQDTRIQVNAGSGFVIDPSGLILTNWHVVANAFEITVTFSDGTRASAEITGAARLVDLAVLRVHVGHKLPAVRWGDSDKLRVGDPVLAVGNPLGIGISVSAGIVSALNRDIGDTPVDDFIQTDAAINHGNSGGPLFNLAGEVVGVNSALVSLTAANAGLGFALPSQDVQYEVEHLMRPGGAVRPGWLGVKLQPVTPEMAEANGFDKPQGAIVACVFDSMPGQRAGLRPGDIILTFDGKDAEDERWLLREITKTAPGTVVTFGVWRFGKRLDLKATLEAWPERIWALNSALPHPVAHRTIPPDLGLTVVPVPDSARERLKVSGARNAVLVMAVAPHSDAARRGLVAGDIIVQAGAEPVSNAADLQHAIDRARGEGRRFAMFLVQRKNPPEGLVRVPGPDWVTLQVGER